MKASQVGKELIKKFEQLRLEPYDDGTGNITIGWGHLLKTDEEDLAMIKKITIEQAELLLVMDIMKVEDCLNELVKVKLTQSMFDSLCSFVFNIGCEAFKKSTLLKLLNKRRYLEASLEFPRWIYSKGKVLDGLIKRRATEQALFLYGYYKEMNKDFKNEEIS